MKTIIAALLLSTIAVHAQEIRVHRDTGFHAADYMGYAFVAGAHVGDYMTTRAGMGMNPAMIETTLPAYVVQSPGRLAAYEFGSTMVIVGTSALFAHTGHHTISRCISYGAGSWGMVNVFRNINAIHTQEANQSKLERR